MTDPSVRSTDRDPITDEAVEAAAKVIHATVCGRGGCSGTLPRDRVAARAALAAAVPLLRAGIEAEVRAEIAAEIEAIPTTYGSGARRDVNRVIGEAADIARGLRDVGDDGAKDGGR